MINLRRSVSSLRRNRFYDGQSFNSKGMRDIEWHGCKLLAPGWNDPECRVMAFTIASFVENEPDLHVMLNTSMQDLDFEIPQIDCFEWLRFADTSLPSPQDIGDIRKASYFVEKSYNVKAHTSVILVSKAR